MRILCLASNYPPDHQGGYGQVAGQFCRGLLQRGHDILVLTRHSRPSEPGVRRILETVAHGQSPTIIKTHCLRNRNHLAEAIRDHTPDVIFSCGNEGIGLTTYEHALASGIPTLTYLGDTWLAQAWRDRAAYDPWYDLARGGRRPGWRRWLKKLLTRGSGLTRPLTYAPITAISQFVVDDLRAAGAPVPRDVPMTYVPLQRHFFRDSVPIGRDQVPSGPLRALFVSRVEALKGPDLAIRMVSMATTLGLGISLTIAGLKIAELQPELENLASELKMRDRIRFAGTPNPEELLSLYRTHDVFLFPSRIVEGLGLVNAEAQACGLPIIGTAGSGAAEAIKHNETGFVVAIDDAAAMAQHLVQLADDPALYDRLSKNGIENAKRFHPDRILDTLEAALKAVIA